MLVHVANEETDAMVVIMILTMLAKMMMMIIAKTGLWIDFL